MKYRVAYTFGEVVIVDADSEDYAIDEVENMETDELLDLAKDGFEVQSVESA